MTVSGIHGSVPTIASCSNGRALGAELGGINLKTALVTGANRGIGAEIAAQLCRDGYHVFLGCRQGHLAETAGPQNAEVLCLDVTSKENVDAVFEHLKRAGGLDALINNAGVALDGFNSQVVEQTLAVNFYGVMRTTDRLLPLLRPAARIVMVSSGLGSMSHLSQTLAQRFAAVLTRDELLSLLEEYLQDVTAGYPTAHGFPASAYSVSKIALNMLTRWYAQKLRSDGRGILCNACCPGWVRTAMGGPQADRSVQQGADTPVWLAQIPDGDSEPTGGFFRDRKPIPF